MSLHSFDRRITPARADRAAATLKGRVEAPLFVDGVAKTVRAPVAPLRREPRADCPLDTEAVRGEVATVYDEIEGWAWVQLARDGYVGYLGSEALGPPETPTHTVKVLRTLVFPGPDLKLPVASALPLASAVAVLDVSGRYSRIAEGWVWTEHLGSLDDSGGDFVSVAERFLGVPYQWGGKTSLGLDCSGLVQLSLQVVGKTAPRDSDMQQSTLGAAVAAEAPFRRGDLVFWPGHVGIMRDADMLIHANAHTMMVSSEPLAGARSRIERTAGATAASVKRLG